MVVMVFMVMMRMMMMMDGDGDSDGAGNDDGESDCIDGESNGDGSDDEDSQQELRRQAATALASWLSRYRGCAENIGIDLSVFEDVAQTLRGVEEDVA